MSISESTPSLYPPTNPIGRKNEPRKTSAQKLYAIQFITVNYFERSFGEAPTHEIESLSYEKKMDILADIESKTICGDANCDGEVTIADAAAIFQYLGNNEKFPLKEIGKSNAGSCDGIAGITAKDALTIQLHKTGLAKLG